MQPADGRRVVLQHGEQAPARLDLVFELDAGDGEQQRLLERRRGPCERADPLGVRGQRLRLRGGFGRARVAARDAGSARRPRSPRRAGRRRRRAGARRRRLTRCSARRSRSASATLASRKARSVALSSARPACASSSAPASRAPRYRSEVSRPPASHSARGVAELAVRADPGAVLVEPAAQPRPRADQRLVGDLGGAVVERDEPRVGEPPEQCAHRLGRGLLGHELVDGHAPARVLAALAELGHAQEHAARQRALLVRQAVDDRIGGARERGGDAAGLAVAVDGERAAVAPLPGGAQRVREQRQRAGLGGDVAQDQLDEARARACSPASRAGSVTARASSAAVIAPSSTWLPATARASSA